MIDLLTGDKWIGVKDGDMRALWLYHRHYSYQPYADGRKPKLFVGPGEKLVLMTVNCDALWVWRKFKSGDAQQGINCSMFRREPTCPFKATELISEAMQHAGRRWPNERLYTYIDPKKVKPTMVHGVPVYGWTWRKCDWNYCGTTKWNKLLIFEYVPYIGGNQ